MCAGKVVIAGVNDLATTHPDVATLADGWDPTTVTAGSGRRLLFKCPLGHSSRRSPVCARTSLLNPRGCPICAGRVVVAGVNDLVTTHPEIAALADGWDPATITAGSGKRLLFRCPIGHPSRPTMVFNRTGAGRCTGCPICANREILVGYNDLATTHPEVAKLADGWDPTTVSAGSTQRLLFACPDGHASVLARVRNRVRDAESLGCPQCATPGYDPGKEGWVYLVRNDVEHLLQIGITGNPRERLLSHKKNGFTEIDILGPMDGFVAQELERDIKFMLKEQIPNRKPAMIGGSKFDGHTESWYINELSVTAISELQDMLPVYA